MLHYTAPERIRRVEPIFDASGTKVGELSPAKRMWQALKDAEAADPDRIIILMDDALRAYEDWRERRRLPRRGRLLGALILIRSDIARNAASG